jgi:two-component system sensor histidine kinase KdpD
MKAGKIYAPDKVPRAIENFFKDRNLATLRELALREVAESLDRAASAQTPADERPRASERVMVSLSSNPPRAAALLRRGSRMAGRLNTDWFVVYVETPEESPERIDSEAQRYLLKNIEKARELGAEVVRLKAADPVPALLDFARSHSVAHVIIGRSRAPLWQRLLGRSILQRLVNESEGLDLHIASFDEEELR